MEEEFQAAAERISGKAESKPTAQPASQADRLKIYALYQQANIGDNNRPKPSIFNVKEKLKWEAWESLKGKVKDEAMAEYIELANRIAPPP